MVFQGDEDDEVKSEAPEIKRQVTVYTDFGYATVDAGKFLE